MRGSLAVAVCTWLLAVVLRVNVTPFLDTLENSRQAMPPVFGWMVNGQPVEIPAFTAIVVPVILYAIALAWWRGRLTWPAATGLGLFVGGAAANTSERFALGGVIDYIPISWPDGYLVNFADLAILAGTVLLAGGLLHSCAVRYAASRRRDRTLGYQGISSHGPQGGQEAVATRRTSR